MREQEFNIVSHVLIETLVSEVNALLAEGWETLGAPFEYKKLINQALVRDIGHIRGIEADELTADEIPDYF